MRLQQSNWELAPWSLLSRAFSALTRVSSISGHRDTSRCHSDSVAKFSAVFWPRRRRRPKPYHPFRDTMGCTQSAPASPPMVQALAPVAGKEDVVFVDNLSEYGTPHCGDSRPTVHQRDSTPDLCPQTRAHARPFLISSHPHHLFIPSCRHVQVQGRRGRPLPQVRRSPRRHPG